MPVVNRSRSTITIALCFIFFAAPAAAQDASSTPVELAETGFFGFGARAMGLGRAYVAVSEDVSAIAYNPAGLAQIRQVEFSIGLAHDETDHLFARSGSFETNLSNTRLEHLAFAYPYPTYRGSMVLAFAFHRMSDLEQDLFANGFLELPTGTGNPREEFGLVEIEDVRQEGIINAWTGAAAIDLSPRVSVGASLSLLTGSRNEFFVSAQGIPDPSAGSCPGQDPDEYGLYYGCGDEYEQVLFKSTVNRNADLTGVTASAGILARLDQGFRVGATVDLPKWLDYDGGEIAVLEDYFFSTESDILFEDRIVLPLSLRGGVSWGQQGLLLAGDVRWSDWKQIDFEGDIRAPNREFAYRATVAVNLGAEYQFHGLPLRVRGGFFTEPIPYELIAADPLLAYDAGGDGEPGTNDDSSELQRFYPNAHIVSDRKFWTLGAGVLIESGLTMDVAYLHGSWERATEDAFDGPSGFSTREKVTENRFFFSATGHFE